MLPRAGNVALVNGSAVNAPARGGARARLARSAAFRSRREGRHLTRVRCAASARWRCQKRRISRMRPPTWTAKTSGYWWRQGGPSPPRQRSESRQARLRHSTGRREGRELAHQSSMSARPSQERNRNSVGCLSSSRRRRSCVIVLAVLSARGMGGKTIEGCAERNGPDLFIICGPFCPAHGVLRPLARPRPGHPCPSPAAPGEVRSARSKSPRPSAACSPRGARTEACVPGAAPAPPHGTTPHERAPRVDGTGGHRTGFRECEGCFHVSVPASAGSCREAAPEDFAEVSERERSSRRGSGRPGESALDGGACSAFCPPAVPSPLPLSRSGRGVAPAGTSV